MGVSGELWIVAKIDESPLIRSTYGKIDADLLVLDEQEAYLALLV